MILITGASGNLGGRVAKLLSEGGQSLRLMVRDKNKAPQLPKAEVVEANYDDPGSLEDAFAGIDAAFVVSVHARPMERALLHKNAFDAAARAEVTHIVYTSFQGASPTSKFPFARDHYQSEQYLHASQVPFTSLRNNFYLDLIPEFFNEDGLILGPAADGALAWVACDDIALVAAAKLVAPLGQNEILDVTGPEALTMAETAERIATLAGRELQYRHESVEDGRKWRSTLGAPDWEVDTWLGSYEAVAAGELAQTSDTVLRVTGRQPLSIEGFFSANPHWLDSLQA